MSYLCGYGLKLSALLRTKKRKRKRKSNREEENALHATLFNPPHPHCDPILHYVVVPQDFYESQWKALLLYQLELLHVFKKCCFNCFDKEINLLPVNCCLGVLSYPLKLKAGFCQRTAGGNKEQGCELLSSKGSCQWLEEEWFWKGMNNE